MLDRAPLSLTAAAGVFHHEALFYADADEFLAGTTAFLREGLDRDEPALVVLNADKLDRLRAELDGDADRVCFADMAAVGANPARIIPAWRKFVDRYAGQRIGVRGIGEPIWPGRSDAELVECQRHESLLNLAFGDTRGFRLLCPYDTSSLDEAVLDEARRSHLHLTEGGTSRESPAFRTLDEVAAPFSDPLPEPPGRRYWRAFQARSLPGLRAWISAHAARAGFRERATRELVLAAHEVATNSIMDAGGGGMCRVWLEGDSIVCEINDKGGFIPPLAGRQHPCGNDARGCGLWFANQLCDLVQVRSFIGGGTVRLHKHRA